MKLPPQLYNELQRGDSVLTCPMCRRILFWETLAERTAEDQSGVKP
jgi:predicted  nucleic acid-binding Zn-ribbon protein